MTAQTANSSRLSESGGPAGPNHINALSVHDLAVKYQEGQHEKTILEKVSFELERGVTLAIVGPNGGGKTTLFRALMNFIPYEGKVTWSKDARKIGYVPQALVTTDLPISVEEFLQLKCKTDLKGCLAMVGLETAILNRHLRLLSGGELQRVLIAWAIVDSPDVLLLDEPTSGVDIGAEEPIYHKVNSLKRELGITTLLITHNMHIVHHYSDYILALDHHPLYFGRTKSLWHSELTKLVRGVEYNLLGHEEHVSSPNDRL